MGRSSKSSRNSKEDRNKKGKKSTSKSAKKGTGSSSSPTSRELRKMIADLERQQQSLAREWQEHTNLQTTAEEFEARIVEAEETLELLSSSSLVAQQRRGVSQLSDDPSHRTYNRVHSAAHLRREVDALRYSVAEFEQRASIAWEGIVRRQEEIEELQRQIQELQASAAGDDLEQGTSWRSGYPDDDDYDEPQGSNWRDNAGGFSVSSYG